MTTTTEKKNRGTELRDLQGGAAEWLEQASEADIVQAMLAGLGRYSPGNVVLILMQLPTATDVAGFHAWKKRGRKVRKGERGLWIWAGFTPKGKDQGATGSQDDKKGASEAGGKAPRTLFRPTCVFDVSQTEPIEGAEQAPAAPAPLTEAEARAKLASYTPPNDTEEDID